MIIYPPLQYPLVLHRLKRGIALYSDKQQLFRRPARVFETNGSGLKTLGNASDGAMITLESGWIFYTHPTIQHIHYTYTYYGHTLITTIVIKIVTSQNCYCWKKVHIIGTYIYSISICVLHRSLANLKWSKRKRKKIGLLFLKLIFLVLIFEEKIRRQSFFIDIFLSFWV